MIDRAPAARRSSHWRRYGILYALAALCAAPVIASYFAFYVAQPSGRTNYGALIEPRPFPVLLLRTLEGREFSFDRFAGKWVMLIAAPAACEADCAAALLQMRQQRLMTGKERERIERAWLITDEGSVAPELLRDYEGTAFLRAPAAAVHEALAPDGGATAGHVWLIDPMGNLMLRWPRDPDPQRVKKDLARLLTASSHWVRIERKP